MSITSKPDDPKRAGSPFYGSAEHSTAIFEAKQLAERRAVQFDDMRSALERISKLTPNAANASNTRDLHLTVRAIAESALAEGETRPIGPNCWPAMDNLQFVEALDYALKRRFPRCRDCADDGPICPNSNLPCDLAGHFDRLKTAIQPPNLRAGMPGGPNPISAAIDDRNGKLIVEAHNAAIARIETERAELWRKVRDLSGTMDAKSAAIESLRTEREEARRDIIEHLDRQIEHVKENSLAMRTEFGAGEAKEGRCRQLAGMYLEEIRMLFAGWPEKPIPLPSPDPRDATIARLNAELAEAMDALAPFARYAGHLEPTGNPALVVSDFQRAHTVLAKLSATKGGA